MVMVRQYHKERSHHGCKSHHISGRADRISSRWHMGLQESGVTVQGRLRESLRPVSGAHLAKRLV